MRVVEIKTVQTSVVKFLIEALKEILTDTNIEFNNSGLRIVAMDSTKTVLVHLKLESDKFEKFECKKDRTIGVSLINLFKLIKGVNNNETLTFYVDDSNINILGITIENADKNKVKDLKLNLMDLNDDPMTIPPVEFESIVTMPSGDFQKTCREMQILSNIVEIKSAGTQLIFKAEGDFGSDTTRFGQTEDGISFVKTTGADIIQGYYNLQHLSMFTKCTNLCNSVEIYMKNNYPIIVKFSVGNLGKLQLALAPIVKDEE